MPRTRYTLASLKSRLQERVGNNTVFWTTDEVRDALNEGICFWQALTGEWVTKVSVDAATESPSFFPVPKQIVSLTRVGIASEQAALNPVAGHILTNRPVFEGTNGVYSTTTGQPTEWNYKPAGGVGPFRLTWDFGQGPLPETQNLAITHEMSPSQDGSDVTVQVQVTDATGDSITVPFTVSVRNQTIGAEVNGLDVDTGGPTALWLNPDFSVPGSVSFTFTLTAIGKIDGSSATNFNGNALANRYPMTIAFDFLPVQGIPGAMAPVYKADLLDHAHVLRESVSFPLPLQFSHTAQTPFEWNNGLLDSHAYGGYERGLNMREDPDNRSWNTIVEVGSNQVAEQGYVRLWMNQGYWDYLTSLSQPVVGNFKITFKDGTGYTAERDLVYTLVPATIVQGHISCIANGAPNCPSNTVELIDQFNVIQATTTADGNGDYIFTNPVTTFMDGDLCVVRAVAPVSGPCAPTLPQDAPSFSWATGTTQVVDIDLPGI